MMCKKLISIISSALDWSVASLVFIMMAITFADVWGRYFLNMPVYGAADIIAHLMALVVFASLPRICIKKEHITVDLLDHLFPERVKKPRNFIVSLVCAIIYFCMAWQVGLMTLDFIEYGDTSSDLLIPKAWIGGFIALFIAFSGIAVVATAIRQFIGILHPSEHKTASHLAEKK